MDYLRKGPPEINPMALKYEDVKRNSDYMTLSSTSAISEGV
jgi:hypothetical protein